MIIANPEILLIEVWLGTKNKYTAEAIIAIAIVRIVVSLINS